MLSVRLLWEGIGWILTLVGTILTLLAGSSGELRLLAVASLATGLLLIAASAPRRHFTTTHRHLVAFSALQFIVMSGFSLIQGAAPVVLDYYGWFWFTFLCVQSILALSLLVITRYAVAKIDFEHLNQHWLQRLPVGLTAFSVVAFCVGIILVLLIRNAPENLLAVVWLTLIWPQGITIIIGTRTNWVPNVNPRLLYAGCGMFIAAGIILSLASVDTFPFFLNTDEPWTVNFSDTLHSTGHLYASFYPDGNVPSRSAPRLYYLTDAWMNLWGRDLFSARTFSLVPGLLLIPVVFGLARVLINPFGAIIAAALLSTNLMWLATSHIARPEMWLTFAVWLAFLLVTVARRRHSSILAFLAGLLIALSAEIHLYGILFCFIFGLWWLLDWRALRREKRLLGAFIFGGLIGAILFVTYHLLPDPNLFMKDILKETQAKSTPWQAMINRLQLYVTANPLEAGLLWLGSIAAFILNRPVRGLAVFLGLTLLTYTLVISDPNMYYTMLYVPGLIILLTSMLGYISRSSKVFFATAAVGALLLNTLVITSYINNNWNQRVLEAFDQVAAQVPATGTVVARPLFYLAFREPRFIAFTYIESLVTVPTPAQYWQGILDVDPKYLITPPQDWGYETISQPLSYNHYMELPVAPKTLMLAYEVLEQVDTPLGTFQIWQKR